MIAFSMQAKSLLHSDAESTCMEGLRFLRNDKKAELFKLAQ
jgi:hypothetical protein